MFAIGRGSSSRWTDSYPARSADRAITATMRTPARSSATVTVGVAAECHPTPHQERDPQRHCGPRVSEVVDGVREQGNGAGREDDGPLRDGRDCERHQADLDGTDALGAGLKGRIHGVGAIVAVRAKRRAESPSYAARVRVRLTCVLVRIAPHRGHGVAVSVTVISSLSDLYRQLELSVPPNASDAVRFRPR